jgi:transposase
MQHVVDSRSGQHVGSRDYTPGFAYFPGAGGGGAAAHSGHCHGAGWAFAAVGGAGRWHQTLRDWVIRSNADGPTGLADRPRPGRQPRLTEAQRCEVAKGVEDGPDRKTDGVVRWRCADLGDRIAAKFDVQLDERSVGKLLKKLNFSSMSGRPTAGACRPAGRNLVSGRSPRGRFGLAERTSSLCH